jgi:hypothetical protein
MKIAALACYVIGMLLELYGAVGVLKTARDARRALEQVTAKPSVVANGPHSITFTTNPETHTFYGIREALESVALPQTTIAALVLGVVVGFAGNVLSLF